MDTSLQTGIEIIKYFKEKFASEIMNMLEKYLKDDKKKGDKTYQIPAIVFLGVCSEYIKQSSSLENIST